MACYTYQRWSYHLSLHMLFCDVILPLLHQELESVLCCFAFGFSLWLLLFREHGRPDAVRLLGIVFSWPGNFGFLFLGSQLSCKITILWETRGCVKWPQRMKKSQDEVCGGYGGTERETKQHQSIRHVCKETILDIQCCQVFSWL